MNNKKFITFLACLILIFTFFSGLSTGINTKFDKKPQNNEPSFQAINIDETTIQVSVNPKDLKFITINTENGLFASLELPGFGFSYSEGVARLPIVRKLIEIPQEANFKLSINSITWDYTSLTELGLPNKIMPAQFSTEKIPERIENFVFDEEYYSINQFLPENIASIDSIGIIRGRNVAQIQISPVQYNPASGSLKIMNSCDIMINLQNCNMIKTHEKIQRYSTSSYEKMFSTAFENYGFYEQGLVGDRDDEGFLAIVYDNFYDELLPLTNLKETKGYDVTITKTSDIPGGPTKENIYSYIEDAYDNWNVPPMYVLLVGDTGQIPTYSGTTGPSAVDMYFVTVDGSDWIPDIHIGRFPGSTEAHIESMVDKTVYYETGQFIDTEWIKKVAFIASSDHGQLAEETHNHVIDNYLNPNGYDCDKIYEASGGNTQDIYDSLNDGRSLCIYSGHGSTNGWGCVPFHISDVNNLENEDMYPFVCSHACSTNVFNQGETYGETWLRAENKGGIGFWGASASTYWDEDDILEKAMFQAWWEDGLSWMGGMTDMGLLYLYENYSGGGSTKYYFEAYNLNGDPSLEIWSDDPNMAPDVPSKPNGPNEGTEYQELSFSVSTTDPEGDMIYYMFDWGNDEYSSWIGPKNSGESVEESYSWEIAGTYYVKVKAKDINNRENDWSEPLLVTINENSEPGKPTINAPNMAPKGKSIKITVSSIDPENHDIFYYISWGDGHTTGYNGPHTSGDQIEYHHAYLEENEYNIVVKPRDEFGKQGPQNQVTIRIIKNRALVNPVFLRIFEQFFSLLLNFLNIN